MTTADSPKGKELMDALRILPAGLCAASGAAAALLRTLDFFFDAAARRRGAGEFIFPTLVSEQTLERAGYLAAFPGYASRVEGPGRPGKYFLSPAVCYPAYERLADSQLDGCVTMTSAGRCFRNDPIDGRHLWEFTVREIIFLGCSEFVRARRQEWLDLATRWVRELGLDASCELATDPFFSGAENRGRKMLQRVKELKYELRVSDLAGRPGAIASFNLHEQFFGNRFNITLRNGEPAFSACVGFGLERWAMALLARYSAAEASRRVELLP